MNSIEPPYEVLASTPEESDYISDKIMRFNAQRVPFTQKPNPIFKRYVIKNNNEIIAGINAVIYHWGILHINELFVSEDYRHKMLGSYLLTRVEKEAKEIGATLSHTDTFDFQAKDFYLKHNYKVFGVLENCPENHNRYYLKKILTQK
jgi:GNAT superfamily N-acetyltransferase